MISLTNFAKKVSQAYKTENVMILFGDDVFFGDLELAKKQFEFIESLRDLAPASSYIRFATASEYFTAVASENLAYSVYEGDFHPYISTDIRNRPISWTGFYASRPALKQKIFKTSALVRAAEISLGLIKKQEFQGFEVSTMLHHDAITGTCRSEVADDYFVRLEKDIKTSEKAIREAYSALLIESDKKFEMNKPYKAYVIYNPINWDVKKIISLDSASQFAVVYDTNGKPLKSQSVPNLDIYKIYFELTLRSLSFNTIFISEEKFNCTWCSVPSVKTGKSTVANSFYSLKFYEGLLDTISTKEIEVNVMTSIVKYQAYLGGAYEFRPPVRNI